MMTLSASYLSILVFLLQLFLLQALNIRDPFVKYSQLNLSAGAFGPESVALDRLGNGPYVGTSDGRILKFDGTNFVDFAYLSPTRTKAMCDGVTDIDSSKTCGRPLGFTSDTYGNFYAIDAYGGLYGIGPNGGRATLLADTAFGVPFHFLNGIDFDISRKVLYLTDASLRVTFKDQVQGNPIPPTDSSGRLMEYNLATRKVRVLLRDLPLPTGPAVSHSGGSVVFGSRKTNQVFKYSLNSGPTAGRPVVLLNLPGFPIKTKRASPGTFWVAVNVRKPDGTLNPFGYKFDINGRVPPIIKDLSDHYPNSQVNVVQEYSRGLEAELYVGSRVVGYVGKYSTIL